MRVMILVAAFVCLTASAGCVSQIGAPQTRTEFVEMVKPGGITRKVEHITVNRPFKAVLKDMKGYSDQCLDVHVYHPGSYAHREVAGTTTYHPKVVMTGTKSAALSVQEEYSSKHANSGAPPGGVFVMVTEFRDTGDNKTEVDIYHLLKGELVKPMKEWIASDKRPCPTF